MTERPRGKVYSTGPRPRMPAQSGSEAGGRAKSGSARTHGEDNAAARRRRKGGAAEPAAAISASAPATRTSGFASAMVLIFMLSLLLPMKIYIGPVQLPPYRAVLLIAFIPLLMCLLSGKAGKMIAIDWLMIGSAFWAVLAFFVNHAAAEIVETAGLYMVEFLGAYLLGRVGVRNAEDMRRLIKLLFLLLFLLLPFALLESVTGRPVLLDLIPKSLPSVDAGVRFGMRRAQTVFAHPIHYGAFVSAAMGMIWYVVDRNKSFFGRIPKAFAVVLSTFFSLSTGALLAVMTQLVLILYEATMKASARRWTVFTWSVIIGYAIVDMIATKSPFHVLVNRMTFSSGSSYNRIRIWQYGSQNVADNPIFGLGLRDWVRPDFMSPSADNFWLLTAMKFGLPSFLMFAIAVFLMIRWAARANLSDPLAAACRAGWLTSLGGIILAGGTVHYWGNIFSFVMLIFGAGVWIAQIYKNPEISGAVENAPKSAEAPRRRS